MTTYMLATILHLYFCLMEIVCSSVVGQEMGPEINIPSDSYQVPLGRMLLLECHVQGTRPLSITWLKSGKRLRRDKNYKLEDKIPTEKGILTYQLWIKEMKLADFGYYTCSANNSYGVKEKNVTVERVNEQTNVKKDSQNNSTVVNRISVFQLYITIFLCLHWSLYNLTESYI